MLLGALDQTIMAPALPAVAQDLGRLDQMPAVVISYLAAATAVMPLYGKLGDRFGRKRTMLVAVAVFVVGATLCATATSMALLTMFRAVQGLGGGGLMVGPQAVIGEIVSPRERGRYLGYIGAAYVVAAVGGPVLGGLIVEGLGWRWIFALYPPLGACGFRRTCCHATAPPTDRAATDRLCRGAHAGRGRRWSGAVWPDAASHVASPCGRCRRGVAHQHPIRR